MIQKSFLGSRNKKILLRCGETWVQSWQPLRVGALLQKLWFQEEAKWVINATDSWKWGDEKHFRTFKCGRSDYSNQNAIPFCYSLPWTARLRKKKPKKHPVILNCAVCINVPVLAGNYTGSWPKRQRGTYLVLCCQPKPFLLPQEVFHAALWSESFVGLLLRTHLFPTKSLQNQFHAQYHPEVPVMPWYTTSETAKSHLSQDLSLVSHDHEQAVCVLLLAEGRTSPRITA